MTRTPRPDLDRTAGGIAGRLTLLIPILAGPPLLAAQEARPGTAVPTKAAASGPDRKAPALSTEQTAKNVESFEVVWKTVRDRHFDPKLGGLDWQAVRDELRPKVERARTMAEARDVNSDALARLRQTHFAIIPSELEPDLQTPREGRASWAWTSA